MITVTLMLCFCVAVCSWWPVTGYRVDHVSYNEQFNSTAKIETFVRSVPTDIFWNAIQQVETGGVSDPENAIGDNGAAIGPLQIHRVYYNDAVQFDHSLQSGRYDGYTYERCMGEGSFEYSKNVGNAYMSRYATEARLGHAPTDEDFARIHNGGPNGWRNSETLKYWYKVQAILNSQ